ncbi:phage/plasmid primase, P4 family [soil metagenome]
MKPPPNLKGLELTELGNARRIAAKFAPELRYVRAWRAWLVWDHQRWRRDDKGIEMIASKEIVEDLLHEAAGLAAQAAGGADDKLADEARAILTWAKASSRRSTLSASAALAESERGIAAGPDEFDVDPWLLNTATGTIDLRTGALKSHQQADMITMLAPVAYDPNALAPTWDRFLAWMLPDREVRAWFWRFVGYCCTGTVGEQILTFLHGSGANGKSTALGAIKYVLGDYAVQGSPALLMATERGSGEELARRQRAVIKGKRLVLVQEIEAGRYLNESQAKQLTGGDTITAAKLYENEVEIEPTHKLVVGTNYRPIVRGDDHGIWRRLRLVPFVSTVADHEKDPDLAAKLRAEAPGILAWAVRGCLEWQRVGLREPVAMRSEANVYRKTEDRLGEFLEDYTEPGAAVESGALYRAYETWCTDRGEKAWTQRALTNALGERGFKADRHTFPNGKRTRAVLGLSLRGVGGVA